MASILGISKLKKIGKPEIPIIGLQIKLTNPMGLGISVLLISSGRLGVLTNCK